MLGDVALWQAVPRNSMQAGTTSECLKPDPIGYDKPYKSKVLQPSGWQNQKLCREAFVLHNSLQALHGASSADDLLQYMSNITCWAKFAENSMPFDFNDLDKSVRCRQHSLADLNKSSLCLTSLVWIKQSKALRKTAQLTSP